MPCRALCETGFARGARRAGPILPPFTPLCAPTAAATHLGVVPRRANADHAPESSVIFSSDRTTPVCTRPADASPAAIGQSCQQQGVSAACMLMWRLQRAIRRKSTCMKREHGAGVQGEDHDDPPCSSVEWLVADPPTTSPQHADHTDRAQLRASCRCRPPSSMAFAHSLADRAASDPLCCPAGALPHTGAQRRDVRGAGDGDGRMRDDFDCG